MPRIEIQLLISIGVLCSMYILTYQDRRKKRMLPQPQDLPNIACIVPCYDDGDSVWATIKSIYESYDPSHIECVVIDDNSSDNAWAVLKELNKSYPFTLIHNTYNQGKTAILNTHIPSLQAKIFFVVDADVILNKDAIEDIIMRFTYDTKVGAISCPYIPVNVWFLARMQSIEYNMVSFVQASTNISSAINLRWWCIACRKQAFQDAWGFALHAISEDMVLAWALNARWRKIEQSPIGVRTVVPNSRGRRYTQKIRRMSGMFQSFFSHRPSTGIHQRGHGFLSFLFYILFLGYIIQAYVIVGYSIAQVRWWNAQALDRQFIQLGLSLLWCVLSCLPWRMPLIKKPAHMFKIVYILPFCFIYAPLHVLVSLVGIGVYLYRDKQLQPWVRAR